MMAFCSEHPKWDQNPKFTPLSETTSIPTPFICGVPPPPGKLNKPAFYGESSIVFWRIRNAYRRVPVDLMVRLPCNWCSAMWLLTSLALACARLSDSMVGTFLNEQSENKTRATWKRGPARFSHLFWLIACVRGTSVHRLLTDRPFSTILEPGTGYTSLRESSPGCSGHHHFSSLVLYISQSHATKVSAWITKVRGLVVVAFDFVYCSLSVLRPLSLKLVSRRRKLVVGLRATRIFVRMGAIASEVPLM